VFKNCDGVLKVDDPSSYLALAEVSMAGRVKSAVNQFRGEGTPLFNV
jgi:hypothetical protein